VLTIGMQRIPIEVKYRRRLEAKDLRGIEAFCRRKKYNAPFGLIITQETQGQVADSVIAIPAYALLALH
jgi:predicted AAA+ superfamily ATPase